MAAPIIDFTPFMVNEGAVIGDPMTPAQEAVTKQLDEVNTGTGFAYLSNIGITSEDLEGWFAASKELFALPEEVKHQRLQQMCPETNAGYSPEGQEKLNARRGADMKESFNIKRPGMNDFAGCPGKFVEAAASIWHKADLAGKRFGLACAMALGVEPDFFTSKLQKMDQFTVRFLHYPPCEFDPKAAEGHGPIRIGEHTDFGLFTLLFLDGPADGLEVKRVEGAEVGGSVGNEAGGWVQVPGLGGATFVVNTGALFARWTNDTWRASAHRVVVPTAAAAASHRYTIACFCDPDADSEVVVDPRFIAPGEAPKYPPTTGGEYVLMKLRESN
mmetsp:Transcript_91021/g.235012  ORF Transcript_91021/g.235012 Transcript_91021/m.235012 type:complete len:330 (+) Transcript_91021:92-1081(+)